MRDDAVLGRALPLDRGLGPNQQCHSTEGQWLVNQALIPRDPNHRVTITHSGNRT